MIYRKKTSRVVQNCANDDEWSKLGAVLVVGRKREVVGIPFFRR